MGDVPHRCTIRIGARAQAQSKHGEQSRVEHDRSAAHLSAFKTRNVAAADPRGAADARLAQAGLATGDLKLGRERAKQVTPVLRPSIDPSDPGRHGEILRMPTDPGHRSDLSALCLSRVSRRASQRAEGARGCGQRPVATRGCRHDPVVVVPGRDPKAERAEPRAERAEPRAVPRPRPRPTDAPVARSPRLSSQDTIGRSALCEGPRLRCDRLRLASHAPNGRGNPRWT